MLLYWIGLALLLAATGAAYMHWHRPRPSMMAGMRSLLLAGIATNIAWVAKTLTGQTSPNSAESLVILATASAAIILYIHLTGRFKNLHVFCLPLIALTQLCALLQVALQRGSSNIAGGALLVFHVACILIGAAAFLAAAAAGIVYLYQVARLKQRGPSGELGKVPALEAIERFNQRTVTIGFALLTVGMFLGFLLMPREDQIPLSVADPKVIFTAMIWMVYALLLHVRFVPRFRGRQAALLSILGFALVVFSITFVVAEFLPTQHP